MSKAKELIECVSVKNEAISAQKEWDKLFKKMNSMLSDAKKVSQLAMSDDSDISGGALSDLGDFIEKLIKAMNAEDEMELKY